MITYAQNFEDVMLARLFGERVHGFYVDVGAWHPTNLSTTKHFYDLGWRGINIEPLSSRCALFQQQRQRDVNLCVAIGTAGGFVTLHEASTMTALSTTDAAALKRVLDAGFETRTHVVPQVSLNYVFETYAPESIDFLKIDVEGAEKDVLSSLDLAKHRPLVILIEATLPMGHPAAWDDFSNIETHLAWESQLIDGCYQCVHFDGLNRFYLREEDALLGKRLSVPPCYFDQIKPAELARYEEMQAENQATVKSMSRRLRQVERSSREQVAVNSKLTEETLRVREASERSSRSLQESLSFALGELKSQSDVNLTLISEQKALEVEHERSIKLLEQEVSQANDELALVKVEYSVQRATAQALSAELQRAREAHSRELAEAALRLGALKEESAAHFAKSVLVGTELEASSKRYAERLDAANAARDASQFECATLKARLSELENAGIRGTVASLFKKSAAKAFFKVLDRAKGTSSIARGRLTVVTPAFNAEDTIYETVRSVACQSGVEVQYLIVDGGSSDRTVEVAREALAAHAGANVSATIISEPDGGMYDAIAKGFALATGEVFAYLNADDLFEAGALARIADYFAAHPEQQLVYHEDSVLINGWKYANNSQPERVGPGDLLGGHILFQDGIFFTRSLYDQVGGVNRKMRRAGDFDLWLRMSAHAKFTRLDSHESVFRIRQGQLSEDMHAYYAEVHDALKSFREEHGLLKTLWWRAGYYLRSAFRKVRRFFSTPPVLRYPIDFGNFPPAELPIGDSGLAARAISPVDGSYAERLLFTSPDTRFGEPMLSHWWLDTRHDIAICTPKLQQETLDSLYKKHYSSPPSTVKEANGPSPFRSYRRRNRTLALLSKFPIHLLAPQTGINWMDNTTAELLKLARRLDTLPNAAGLRFLDAGCFEGNLLSQLSSETTWSLYGLEPNPLAAEKARATGATVFVAHMESALEAVPKTLQFELIYLGQSLEHVESPKEVLKQMRALLAPGGHIILSTPNLNSGQTDLYGPTWAHWHAPYHRFIYSIKGLRALAHQVGLSVGPTTSYAHPYWTAMSIVQNWLGMSGSVSHAVPFEKSVAIAAQKIAVYSRLFWDWRQKGDYIYLTLHDHA